MLTQLLQKVNSRLPFVKYLLPVSVKRWIIWNFMGGKADYESKSRLPSRRYLEMEILPWLRASRCSVLFVGAGPYTYPYHRAFETARLRFATIDINPGARVWGAREHYVASILEVDQLLPSVKFDAVLCNGVFGFGVNRDQDKNRALQLFSELLNPRGILLLGWNNDLIGDPLNLDEMRRLFEPAVGTPFLRRMVFETHVYDLFTKKPAGFLAGSD